MTGPNYPPVNKFGSNAIGSFIIGISQIGSISPFDVWTTIISQYANSPVLNAMIERFNAAIDKTGDFDNFYDFMMNIETAIGYGLDVLGRIVGVSRILQIPGNTPYFGFNEPSSWTGFGQGQFYTGGGTSSNYVLLDDQYRTLIYAKAAANICDGSIQSINSILLGLFLNRGTCYVADNKNMNLTYTFKFALTAIELAIIQTSGVLPNPVGVVVNISQGVG